MPEEYGDYVVESFLGKGSIGKVYLARHRRIGRRVALKTVVLDQKFEDEQDQSEFYKRLQREAELCASMQHPNIVTLYDVGYDGDVVSWLATEYVDGEPLLARLRRTRPLPLEEALAISADLLRGLAYAHSKGIIHRDVKPANILLTSAGQAKIADFGVARPLHSSLTATRSLVGTPNYMSPEQVKTTPVSTRSDLFSIGTVMYELLTGNRPFASPELSAILYNVVNLVPPLASTVNPEVPETIARIVQRLMAKNPDERYATAEEALAGINAVRDPHPLHTLSYATTVPQTLATPEDFTTPNPTIVEPAEASLMLRPVPARVFWPVTLVLIAALGTTILMLRDRAADAATPQGVITREQVLARQQKEQALTAVRALTSAERYEDAVIAYDQFLARYPESAVARSERAEAQRLLEEAAPKAEVTRVARKSRPKPKPPEEPEKKPSRWERVKRWFRGS